MSHDDKRPMIEIYAALGGPRERRVRIGAVVAGTLIGLVALILAGGEPVWLWLGLMGAVFVVGNLALRWAIRKDKA